MQTLNDQNNRTKQKYIQLLEEADTISLTSGQNESCVFCQDIDTTQIISLAKHGVPHNVNVCPICANPTIGYFMVKTMEKQTKAIATNYTIKLPTNRPKNIMNDLIAILHQTDYKKEVNVFQKNIYLYSLVDSIRFVSNHLCK